MGIAIWGSRKSRESELRSIDRIVQEPSSYSSGWSLGHFVQIKVVTGGDAGGVALRSKISNALIENAPVEEVLVLFTQWRRDRTNLDEP